jgi:hypothetical protein
LGGIAAGISTISIAEAADLSNQQAQPPAQLPGTETFNGQGDMAEQMVEGIHNFLLNQTEASTARRQLCASFRRRTFQQQGLCRYIARRSGR